MFICYAHTCVDEEDICIACLEEEELQLWRDDEW
jgi:hypothetical protein